MPVLRTLLLGVASAAFAAACATNPCDRAPPCANDPAPSASDRDRCRTMLMSNASNPCVMEFVAYYNCAQDNVVCDTAGRTDPSQSGARAMMNCATQLSALSTCCMANASAAVCH